MRIAANDLAARLSGELARATAMSAQLEQTLHFGAAGERSSDVRTLQYLDLLTQTLADLTRFTAAVVPLLPAAPLILSPALETLTLRGIADRLCGQDDEVPGLVSGDLALF
ncbi:hypothetical protein ACOI1H_00025 [Loktanella sp. DJP18]|uniref:hypothetical protein n=1 Tax=Loktanella sp. DJP18 TaxID=3409788 RepID=UPI003BB698EA